MLLDCYLESYTIPQNSHISVYNVGKTHTAIMTTKSP